MDETGRESGLTLVLDNYDSFTFNLVQLLATLSRDPAVVRSDAISVAGVAAHEPAAILLSPGPGTPDDAGVCRETVQHRPLIAPILGVCLGHQCIAAAFGARIRPAVLPRHGKVSQIRHNATGIFEGIANPFPAARYHSLAVEKESLPPCIEATAWSEDGEIMALRHIELPIVGVQFHPESFLTPDGSRLLRNFFELYVDGSKSPAA